MIEVSETTPRKIAKGYSMPQVAVAVVIAIGLHGALLGATFLGSALKGSESPATPTPLKAGTVPPTDGKGPSPAPADSHTDKPTDGAKTDKAPEQTPDQPRKETKSKDSGDELPDVK